MTRFDAFDQHSEHHRDHGEEDLREMREHCPIVKSNAYGGFYVLSRYRDISEAARHPETFSSALDPRDPIPSNVPT